MGPPRAQHRTVPAAPLGKPRHGEAQPGLTAPPPSPAPPASQGGPRGSCRSKGPTWSPTPPQGVGRTGRRAPLSPCPRPGKLVARIPEEVGGPAGGRAPRGAYWVTSVRSSLPPKLSWLIWCQERRPSGACRGEVAVPASAWAGSGWALSLDHFHLTGDTTQTQNTKNSTKALGRAARPSVARVCWVSELTAPMRPHLGVTGWGDHSAGLDPARPRMGRAAVPHSVVSDPRGG